LFDPLLAVLPPVAVQTKHSDCPTTNLVVLVV
jgi:hypothetical protein